MRNTGRIALLAILSSGSVFLSGCGKSTPATADSVATASTTTSGTVDKNAARAQILGADSAFVRAVLAKNVDSLMPYYDADVVSMGEGSKAVKGTSDVRKSYTEMVKNPPRELTFESGGVNFSDDGSMAWDYGTYAQTMTDAKGKPVKASGNFLNVWKRVGGRWVIVAEINNSSNPTP
ncbi:MAG TPA: nuclear transport factor 2 family protein [Gemmatimonadaceae bacterium]|jgi:ketosteroid isomerase-like protein